MALCIRPEQWTSSRYANVEGEKFHGTPYLQINKGNAEKRRFSFPLLWATNCFSEQGGHFWNQKLNELNDSIKENVTSKQTNRQSFNQTLKWNLKKGQIC